MSEAIMYNGPHSIKTPVQLLKDLVRSPKLSVEAPKVVGANSTIAAPALIDRDGQAVRAIQNCCLFPVKWMIGGVPTVDSFHGVLAPCTAVDDGTSPILDLSAVRGSVYILGVGGTPRVATFEAFIPS